MLKFASYLLVVGLALGLGAAACTTEVGKTGLATNAVAGTDGTDGTDDPVACGGRAGDTCGADQYCHFDRADVCGRADAQGTCAPRPLDCADIDNVQPVCGCDGATYGTDCAAALAGTGVLADGACAIAD